MLREATHAYLGLSPWLGLESKLFVKPRRPDLEKELSAPGISAAHIAIGPNRFPPLPADRAQVSVMRGISNAGGRAGNPVRHRHKSA